MLTAIYIHISFFGLNNEEMQGVGA